MEGNGVRGGRQGVRKRRAQDKDKCKELLIYLSDSCRFPRMRKHLWGVLNKHTLIPHLIKREQILGGGVAGLSKGSTRSAHAHL